MYYFVNPKNKELREGSPDHVDWEFANKEICQAKGFSIGGGAELSKEQVMAQEQVLEILPLISEVNAVSEELNKHKSFEVVLISGASQGAGADKGTRVSVKMKNLLNNNVCMWDRGKFMNRRFLIQDVYQRFVDGEDVSKIKKEEDPFWEPPEDVLIGTANVFLQSLSYALDFDDKLSVTDYKGTEQGSISINVTPCTAQGKPLDEDHFVDDPKDLLGKPYHFKVLVRNAEVQMARYSHGLYIKFHSFKESDPAVTPTKTGTLSPNFNFSKLFSFHAILEEHLDWFETGCLSFNLYGKQNDKLIESRLKMTTKELRQMDTVQTNQVSVKQATFRDKSSGELAQLKSEVILYKRRYQRMLDKEKRIQSLVTEWGKSPTKDFDGFHRAMQAAAFYERGKLKYKVNMLKSYLKNQPDAVANGGQIKTDDIKVADGSKACSLM